MNRDKDIFPENKEGEFHGYCEEYYPTGELYWKGICVNGPWYGYVEAYNQNGSIWEGWGGYIRGGSRKNSGIGYYSNGYKVSEDNDIGYCYIWDRVET